MRRAARLGDKVVLLDESGNWKGTGTAIQMAEQGHDVTIVTPCPTVMFEMARTNADVYARQRLRELGVVMMAETVMLEWRGDSAVVRPSGGTDEEVVADSLVIAETPVAATMVAEGLNESALMTSPHFW